MKTSISQQQMDEYKKEAKKRWGTTDAYKQSEIRTANWTKEQYRKVQEDSGDISSSLAKAMDLGIEHPVVQKLIARHFAFINQFYDCTPEMYRGLGAMYVEDPRFTETYEKYRSGLAVFLRDAIRYYCDHHAYMKGYGNEAD